MTKTDKYYPIIEIIEEDYEIPQLGRKRRISALLPYDYHEHPKKKYPILYLHDGQNLFDEYAPFGNWGVDKSLRFLASHGIKDIIIVAIDHGGPLRIQEYLPFQNTKFRDSEGKLYLKFMMETLKPEIEKRYRICPEREKTGIGGSSMGGLISLYAGMAHKDVFGKMMIFSPSLWLSSEVYTMARNFVPHGETDIYLYAGGMESETHYDNVCKLEKILTAKKGPFSKFHVQFAHNPKGTHSEFYWAQQFPIALQWLYFI